MPARAGVCAAHADELRFVMWPVGILPQGHAGRALDDAEAALRYDSDHVKAFWRKGQALERMQMREEACEAYRVRKSA